MKIIPLHNNIVIKQVDESETIYGNIIVPDTGKEKPFIGVIVASGPGIINMNGILIPNIVKVGSKVAFPSFGGQRLPIKGEDFLIYKEQDILCVLEDNEEPPLILSKDITNELLNNTNSIPSPLTDNEVKKLLTK